MKDHQKFRLWHQGEFWYWSISDPWYLYSKDLIRMYVTEFADGILIAEGEELPNWESCSGLPGKNGKLIYEGDDIMAHHDRYRVLFENGAFYVEKEGLTGYRVLLSQLVGLTNGAGVRRINSFEIVGHIHEEAK